MCVIITEQITESFNIFFFPRGGGVGGNPSINLLIECTYIVKQVKINHSGSEAIITKAETDTMKPPKCHLGHSKTFNGAAGERHGLRPIFHLSHFYLCNSRVKKKPPWKSSLSFPSPPLPCIEKHREHKYIGQGCTWFLIAIHWCSMLCGCFGLRKPRYPYSHRLPRHGGERGMPLVLPVLARF